MPEKIRRLTYSADRELGIEIIPIDDQYVKTRQNLIKPVRSSFYTILWFLEGTPVQLIDFQKAKIVKDSVLFIGKDAVHFFDQQHSFKARALLFTDDFFCRDDLDRQFLSESPLFNALGLQQTFCSTRATTTLTEIWRLLERELSQPKDVYQSALLRNLLHNFLLSAQRETGPQRSKDVLPSSGRDILLRFKAQIEKNYREQKPVIFYTRLLHVSTKVLSKITQDAVGRTPKQLIDDRLLLEAKRLLANTGDAGKTIGYELGFNEPTNFIKYFRRHTAMTPAEFRSHYTQG